MKDRYDKYIEEFISKMNSVSASKRAYIEAMKQAIDDIQMCIDASDMGLEDDDAQE